MFRPLLLGLAAVAVSAAAAQDTPPRDRRSTEVFVAYYTDAESWPVRALALLALGSHWHPVGTPALVDALDGKDERMRPFGLEVLRRTREDVLRAVASEELVDALLDVAKSRHPLERERALEVLRRLSSDEEIVDRRAAERWWRQVKREGWTPAEWPAIPKSDGDAPRETTTEPLMDRALDLREAGLDLVIVIDSTGSMQPLIDEAVRALDDLVEVLGAIAPRFRVGVVHYKDLEDMSDGARLLLPLSKGGNDARKELEKLRAGGGGDLPERVEKGLEVALDRATRWNPDANKLVLVVGDAPPHPETEAELLERVRRAHERGLDAARGAPVTGERKAVRPVVVSTVSAAAHADRAFREIATAGGGTFARLGARGRGRAVDPRQPKDEAPVESGSATQVLCRHVLAGSFGSQWRDRIGDFVAVWFEYREAAEQKRR